MNKKLVSAILAVLFIVSVTPLSLHSVNATGGSWYDGNWSYRKSHTVNPATGAGTNYQIRIVVHYGSGSDSGNDVYLSSQCRTDFGDIRFTDSGGQTLLNYWMESDNASSAAIFWVKVSADLSSSAQTIYIYYGNPSATSISNCAATFARLSYNSHSSYLLSYL